MSTLYVWEAANLFVGTEDPTKSKHLKIMSLKLPSLSLGLSHENDRYGSDHSEI